MPEIVGVRFKPCGKIYDFEVNGIDVKKGDLIVVESELGLNIGNVVIDRHSIEEYERELKKIIRKVTEEDLYQKQENKNLEREAMDSCLERIMARGLPMKLISTEATLDRKRIIFYFTAEKRIDFRELVKDLAAKFKTRIEMRQIGVRDGAKITGSLGICGRELCCTRFLTSFEPISIKMAKKQELVLNTGKLSGVCGRLMCCLGFEYSETYSEEDINPTKANTITVSEVTEASELFIDSSDSFGEVDESVTQPIQQPQIHENKGKHRKFKRHRKRRKRKPPKQ
ncbi:MAG: regulatory iron-sulfur-containing complex subunit RicT [Nitrospirota bacterium]